MGQEIARPWRSGLLGAVAPLLYYIPRTVRMTCLVTADEIVLCCKAVCHGMHGRLAVPVLYMQCSVRI